MLKDKPYLPLWYLLPFLLFGFMIYGETDLDIQLHDTYFVISSESIGVFFGLLLAGSGVIYWLLRNKRLIKWMTTIHVLSLLFISVFMFLILFAYDQFNLRADRETFFFISKLSALLILILCLSKFIFAINIGYYLLRNQNRRQIRS